MTKSKRPEFRPNEFVVYPAHGVGRIISIEEQEIAGLSLELFVISFEKDKMTLRVPTHKATDIGMRSLSAPDVVARYEARGVTLLRSDRCGGWVWQAGAAASPALGSCTREARRRYWHHPGSLPVTP